MSAALDARPGRGPARWIASVGLWGGAVCLLIGATFHLGAGLDAPPATPAKDADGSGVTAHQAGPQDNRSRQPAEEGAGGAGTAALQRAAPDASPATWVGHGFRSR